MAQVTFNYNSRNLIILCEENETIRDICKKFAEKTKIDINSIYFIYSGKKININLTFSQCANDEDKQRKKMIILVNNIYNNNNNINQANIKSKDIICPICKKNCKIKIKNYKIQLYDCKNKHNINNIPLNEFENTQFIDESKIICNKCKYNSKNQIYNHEFYKCNSCDLNLCPICKLEHQKIHNNIINYEKINYICNLHNEIFNSYCKKCGNNICMFCEKEHEDHEIIYFGKIIPNKNEVKDNISNLKEKIDKIKIDVEEIINILNKIIENIEINYKINNDIINNNIEFKNKNYEILYNLREINDNTNNIIEDINNIINEKNANYKLRNLYQLFSKMNEKEKKINIYNNNNEEQHCLNINKNTKIEEYYSYECINSNFLISYIYEGTSETKIKLTLRNNGKNSWPKNTKIIFDRDSNIIGNDIQLKQQNPGEEKNYIVNFKNLRKYPDGEYNSFLRFFVDKKSFGEKLSLKIIIIQKDNPNNELEQKQIRRMKEFRDMYALEEDDYTDGELFEILEKNNYIYEKAFNSLPKS